MIRFLGIICLVVTLTACAHGPVWLDEANLTVIEDQLSATEMRLSMLEQTLAVAQTQQSEHQRTLQQRIDELQQGLQPPVCPEPNVGGSTCPDPSVASQNGFEGKQVIGEIEQIRLSPPDIELPARIDTGAATSSLDARDIQVFERDGDEWVRFKFAYSEQDSVQIEQKMVRVARILQSVSEESERRPVIELHITLGGIEQSAQFTLSDRSHLEFSVLIGRNVLKDLMLVDVSRANVAPLKPPETIAEELEAE